MCYKKFNICLTGLDENGCALPHPSNYGDRKYYHQDIVAQTVEDAVCEFVKFLVEYHGLTLVEGYFVDDEGLRYVLCLEARRHLYASEDAAKELIEIAGAESGREVQFEEIEQMLWFMRFHCFSEESKALESGNILAANCALCQKYATCERLKETMGRVLIPRFSRIVLYDNCSRDREEEIEGPYIAYDSHKDEDRQKHDWVAWALREIEEFRCAPYCSNSSHVIWRGKQYSVGLDDRRKKFPERVTIQEVVYTLLSAEYGGAKYSSGGVVVDSGEVARLVIEARKGGLTVAME